MTTFTLLGQVCDADGFCVQTGIEGRSMSCWPAGNYRSRQADHVGVHLHHRGPELGEVVHLEQAHRHLWAVAVVDLDRAHERDIDQIAGPLYFSPAVTGRWADPLESDDITLEELSLTDSPAGHGLQPVTILVGDIGSSTDRGRWPYQATHNPVIVNAVETVETRRRSMHRGPLHIRRTPDIQPLADGGWLVDGQLVTEQRDSGKRIRLPDGSLAELEYRPGRILAVH